MIDIPLCHIGGECYSYPIRIMICQTIKKENPNGITYNIYNIYVVVKGDNGNTF